MTAKIYGLSLFVLAFAILFSVGAYAADLTLSLVSQPTNVAHDAGQFTVRVNVVYNGSAQSVVVSSLSDVTGGIGSVTLPSFTMTQNQSRVVDATVTFPAQQSGSIAGHIQVDARSGGQQVAISNQIPFSVPIQQSGMLTLTKVQEITASQDGVFNVTNTGNVILTNVLINMSGNIPATLSRNSIASLGVGETVAVHLTPNSTFDSRPFGTNSATITAKTADLQSNSLTFESSKTFCKSGQVGELTLDSVKISNSGDDDTTWTMLNTVTVKVKFSNDGDEDLKKVEVDLGLFDSDGKNVAKDLDFRSSDEDKVSYGTLKDGDSDEITFEFVVPADFDEGDYKLAVKVYSKDSGEAEQCVDEADSGLDDDYYQEISVERETDSGKYMAFDNVVLTPSEAQCGETVTLTGDIFNVGDEDQDRVKVNLGSRELNVQLSREISGGLDTGDSEGISFSFTVPQNARDGTYNLALDSEYDYNSRLGEYREQSDERFTIPLKVVGCGTTPVPGQRIAKIDAALGSEAVAGKDLIVRATITNLKNEESSFTISASGYDSWATLKDISDRSISLEPGEVKDVTLTFATDPSVQGEQTFTLEASSDDQIASQEVAVTFAAKSNGGFSGFNFGGGSLIWIIGAINVILVILIILVAIRISRK